MGFTAAVLLTLGYGKSRLLEAPSVIAMAALGITASAIAMQAAVALDLTVFRWFVGAGAALALATLVGRHLFAPWARR